MGVPEDRTIRTDFGHETVLHLSSAEREYAALVYPVSQGFGWDAWQGGFDAHWHGDPNDSVRQEVRTFKRQVLENITYYRVPVIALDR